MQITIVKTIKHHLFVIAPENDDVRVAFDNLDDSIDYGGASLPRSIKSPRKTILSQPIHGRFLLTVEQFQSPVYRLSRKSPLTRFYFLFVPTIYSPRVLPIILAVVSPSTL
jgi:hypothetical protein